MTNREKAKEVLEQTFGVDLSNRFLDTLKGCDKIKNYECNTYQDCEHCSLFHFWYKEYTGNIAHVETDKEKIIKDFKSTLLEVISEEKERKNGENNYIYSINEEKVFVKMIDLIWNTDLD